MYLVYLLCYTSIFYKLNLFYFILFIDKLYKFKKKLVNLYKFTYKYIQICIKINVLLLFFVKFYIVILTKFLNLWSQFHIFKIFYIFIKN